MEAADRAGEFLEQDLIAGPGADIGKTAERARVSRSGAAYPGSGEVSAQWRA
ncbi:MAG TPA: hypothetical protein VMV92_27760 [Streptosporangiaceae bacterium]|nr:hypothetical protein [Streptosporangiaceae bacterium]